MSTQKYGFRDMRTAAELVLAPAQPTARVVSSPAGVKTGKGFGAIVKAASMPSSIFAGMKAALAAKTTLASLSGAMSNTVNNFDAATSDLVSGMTTTRDTEVFRIDAPAEGKFFSASDMAQFSALKPGQTIADSLVQQTQLSQRKTQLAGIAARLSRTVSNFSLFGSRVQENYNRTPYPLPEELDRPSFPRLAQGLDAAGDDPILRDKRRSVVKGAPVAAAAPSFWTRLTTFKSDPLKSYKLLPGFNPQLNMSFADKSQQSGWSEPSTPYAAQFPYNKVQQTESGHVFELDDTPGAERVHIFHRSGSFIEMHPDGKVVYKSASHGYLISMADQYVKVKGNCHISVDGDASIHARGDINLQSDKNVNVNTKQDFNVYAENINLRAKKKAKLDGTEIDLRYAKLPGIPVFTVNGPAVRIIPATLRADFPEIAKKMDEADNKIKGSIKSLKSGIVTSILPRLASAAASVSTFAPSVGTTLMAIQIAKQAKDTIKILDLMQGGLPGVPAFTYPALTAAQIPKENPLGNPLVYHAQTVAAQNYRSLMFDTPEELSDIEHYQAHRETRKVLGDLSNMAGPELAGVKTTYQTGIAEITTRPLPDYLDRDAYRGTYTFNKTDVLANTSFTVSDLVDSLSRPDVANHITESVS